MSERRGTCWGAGVAIVVTVVLAAGLAVRWAGAVGPPTTSEERPTTDPDPNAAGTRETATVERRDLIRTEAVDGTLTYGDRRKLSATREGTITALPDVGATIGRGTPLWEQDGAPGPVLLYGARPLWRSLSTASDDGPDIRQLEENLVELGMADPTHMTVDDEFTSETARAVKRWQKSLGREQTGTVDLGDALFQTGPVRVVARSLTAGDRADGAVLEVTDTVRRVHVDLDTADAALATIGATVEVERADGSTVAGTITAVGSTAEVQDGQDGSGSTTTIDVEIDLAADVQALDESPVDVSLVSSRAVGVLAVPVQALLALAEGGYAVERVGPDGSTELVGVALGAFADDWVEVTGELSEGDQVVMA